jgi:hypothetical protein
VNKENEMDGDRITPLQLFNKYRELSPKRSAALEAIVAPARAAANAMLDANMKRTAEPLNEALFKYDAIVSEMTDGITQLQPDQIAEFFDLILPREK